MAACWCHPRLCPAGTSYPDVPWAVPSCARCPGVPPGSAQLFQVPRCPTGSAQLCSVQMLVPSQAAGLSVKRALLAQQRRQEASLPCEHTALSFMAKNSPPGCGPGWKSPLHPWPAHVYSIRGEHTALSLPPSPAHHLPARVAALGRDSSGPLWPKHTGWGGGGRQNPKKHWVCLQEEQPVVMS